jgi:hypothetical protein
MLSILAATALAVDPQDTQKPQLQSDKPAVSAADKAELPAAATATANRRSLELRNAMNDEIAARLVAEKATIATLTGELDRAAKGDGQLAVQRRIQAAKQSAWRDVLGIQLKYANLGGHPEQARDLEERIARLNEGLSQPQALPQADRRDGSSKGGR